MRSPGETIGSGPASDTTKPRRTLERCDRGSKLHVGKSLRDLHSASRRDAATCRIGGTDDERCRRHDRRGAPLLAYDDALPKMRGQGLGDWGSARSRALLPWLLS